MLLYPPGCAICDTVLKDRHALVCDECRKNLPWVRQPVCLSCGRPLEPKMNRHLLILEDTDENRMELCPSCMNRKNYFAKGASTFLYAGQIRESILRMKFHNRRDHIAFYASAMAHAHAGFLRRYRPDVIVPIPMHKKKIRKRGFDQCALLAKRFSDETGIPVLYDALVRVRYTKAQKGLGVKQRQENLQGAFMAGPSLTSSDGAGCPQRILLLDDILTTGTTINEAAKVLRKEGAEAIYFITAAVAPKG